MRTYPKNDGSTGASLTLRVFSVQLLGGRSDNNAGGGGNYSNNESSYSSSPAAASSNIPAASDITEPIDDLPF